MYRGDRFRLVMGGLAFWLLSAVTLPSLGEAQTPEDSLREAVGEELVRALPLWREMGAAARTADRERTARLRAERQLPVDTFQAGPFRLIAEPKQKGMAERLFQEVWEDWGEALSGSEGYLEPWTFLVRRAWSREGMYFRGDSLLVSVELGRQYPWLNFHNRAYSQLGMVLGRGLPADLRGWVRSLSLSDQDREWVARELASEPSFAVHRCYLGELELCRRVLGLTEEELAWSQFYNPPERRLVVSRGARPSEDPRRGALWDGCVEHHDLPACDAFLEGSPPEIPMSYSARSSLLAFALRLGGEGSFLRLRQAESGSVLEKLAEAAGAPPDTLLAAWRREALEAQASAWAGLAKTPVAALFWLVLFGFLATRSTRWRLG